MATLRSLDPVRLALALAALIALLGLLGAIEVRYEAAPAFDLDDELKLPAFAAALILLLAAATARLAAAADPADGWPWLVLAALFALMAADEAVALHEALEDLFAVDWQILYLPLMAAGGVAWLVALLRVRRLPVAAVLLAAGAAAWAVAGVLESIQWVGPRETERAIEGYGILMGVEEVLEMAGSAAFALSPLIAARAWASVRAATVATPAGAST
jgi:hypothetical protein